VWCPYANTTRSPQIISLPLPHALPRVTTKGSDPLPGESEADYVARQRKLQDEARERMRAKFGGSAGLNRCTPAPTSITCSAMVMVMVMFLTHGFVMCSGGGGGKLAGIGSDASYRPGGGGGGGGGLGVNINAAEVTAQLSEVSKNAMVRTPFLFLAATISRRFCSRHRRRRCAYYSLCPPSRPSRSCPRRWRR